MTSATEWFEKGEHAVKMSFTADYGSEYRSDLETAIEAFDQVLALEPSHLGALRARGLCQAKLDQHEAALDSFVAAAVLAPDDAGLRLAVAQSLVKMNRFEEAVGAFEETLRLRPGDEEAKYGRAECLMALGRDELALSAWNEVLKAPDNKTINLQGRTMRVLTDDFRRTRALVSQAMAMARLGKADAQGAFRAVCDAHSIQLAGSTVPVFREALSELEVARAAYREHLAANADDPNSWRRAVHVWRAAGFPEEAAAAEREAEARAEKWQVWGRDTFSREDFLVGTFQSKAAAEAKLAELESRAEKQDESLRDEYWLMSPSPSGKGSG